MTPPFLEIVAMSRKDAAKCWPESKAHYGIEYMGQADPAKHKFGARTYRLWTVRPTPELRARWEHMPCPRDQRHIGPGLGCLRGGGGSS
jgi:hypothetical protein